MKNSNKKSKKYLIILLVVFLLALAIGYAAFTDILTIDGTANAKGSFDLIFASAEVTEKVGVNETETTASISTDQDTLTVTVKDIAYPGAGATITAQIENVGTIPAKIKSVTPTDITGDSIIKIEGLDAITTAHETIPAGGTCEITFTVQWDPESTTELTAAELASEEGHELSFDLEIEYEQDTDANLTGTPAHTDA